MCGRFVGFRSVAELASHFPIDNATCEATANYNVAPLQEVLAIVRREGANLLEKLHWGLVPFWAKDVSIGNRLINARSETAAEKPSFRSAFRRRRCLILADGFYEWTGPKGERQPVYLTLPDEAPFAFAGLWETWDDKGPSPSRYRSCTILTRAASPSVRPIHHRMPVILAPTAYAPWLDPMCQDTDRLGELLQSQILTDLIHRPVNRRVNAARHNDAANIAPLQQARLDLGDP
ncbi:MAG: SOS response-associated peptidase [Desulfosarcinaceae bacterium]|nr:SOS response-associated peptidase [Desulfosarcinaceae bacterium]